MKVNRLASETEDAIGTLGEINQLRLDKDAYMSCGDPLTGVARCRHADICNLPWKGLEGHQKVYDYERGGEGKDDIIKRNNEGQLIQIERIIGGPKTMAVYHKDTVTQRPKAKVQMMPCYRFYDNQARWQVRGQEDVVAILAVEGDGKLVPMKETKKITLVGPNGGPKQKAVPCRVARAVPFHPRPAEVLPERSIDLEIEKLLKDQQVARNAAVIGGLSPEDRPIELHPGPEGVVPDVRQAARAAGVPT